jgi:hypothetical protein
VAYDVSPSVNLLQNKVNSYYEHCFTTHIVWLVLLAQRATRVWKLLLALPIAKRLHIVKDLDLGIKFWLIHWLMWR